MMETTVVKLGTSLGFMVPNAAIKDFDIKVGTKIELTFMQDNKLIIRKKKKIRDGWDAAFAQYAMDGEDKPMLPDFLDSEADTFL